MGKQEYQSLRSLIEQDKVQKLEKEYIPSDPNARCYGHTLYLDEKIVYYCEGLHLEKPEGFRLVEKEIMKLVNSKFK